MCVWQMGGKRGGCARNVTVCMYVCLRPSGGGGGGGGGGGRGRKRNRQMIRLCDTRLVYRDTRVRPVSCIDSATRISYRIHKKE